MLAYLSGPMTGMPDNNKALFDEAARELRSAGWHIVSPVELDPNEVLDGDGFTATDEEYEQYLSRDLTLLDNPDIDAIIFLPGWSKSGGAGREGEKAVERGLRKFMWMPDTPRTPIELPSWLFEKYHTTARLRPEGVKS